MPTNRVEIELLVKDLATKEFRKVSGEIDKTAKSGSKSLNKLSEATNKFAKRALVAVAAVASFRAGLNLAKDIISVSSAADELNSSMEVLFGDSLPKVNAELREFGDSINRGTGSMKAAATDFQAFLTGMGQTKEAASETAVAMVKLAVDTESLRNIPLNVVIEKIVSGLAGEAEAVRRLGADVSALNIDRLAEARGIKKVGGELTQQQKIMLRVEEITRALSVATGDAERTQKSYENTLRTFNTRVDEAKVKLGKDLTAAILQAVEDFGGIDKAVATVTDGLKAFVAVSSGVVDSFGFMVDAGRKYADILAVINQALRDNIGLDPLGAARGRGGRAGSSGNEFKDGPTRRDLFRGFDLSAGSEGGIQGPPAPGGGPFSNPFPPPPLPFGATAGPPAPGGAPSMEELFGPEPERVPETVERTNTELQKTGDLLTFMALKGAEISAQFAQNSPYSQGVAEAQANFESFLGAYESGFRNAQQFQDVFVGAIDSFSDKLIEGELNFKDFVGSLLKELLKVKLQQGLLSLFGGAIGGASGALAGGGVPGAEYGGVFSGGVTGTFPVRGYAAGGIADSPQVAIFGEGRGAEAFVPLPGPGRGIPVELNGQGGGGGVNANVTINVTSLDPRNATAVIMQSLPDIESQIAARLQAGRSRGMVDAVRKASGGQ